MEDVDFFNFIFSLLPGKDGANHGNHGLQVITEPCI